MATTGEGWQVRVGETRAVSTEAWAGQKVMNKLNTPWQVLPHVMVGLL